MRIFKTILSILTIYFIFSCGKNPERQARNLSNNSSVEKVSEMESEVVKNNGKVNEDLIGNDSIDSNEDQTQNVQGSSEPEREMSESEMLGQPQTTDLNWWLIVAVFSILINVTLLLLLVKTIIAKDKYKRQRNDIEIGKNKYKNEALRLSAKLEDFEKKASKGVNKSRDNQTIRKPSTPNALPKKTPTYDDEKSPEISLSVNNTEPKTYTSSKRPINLFAEKANDNKVFSSVTEQKNDHRSVFKLILEDANSEKAEFEIVDSDFILRMVVNSPDTYLYPVCIPENSNQNYSGEIITVKRGVAHKVDGKWKVNEEDKATIKFQ